MADEKHDGGSQLEIRNQAPRDSWDESSKTGGHLNESNEKQWGHSQALQQMPPGRPLTTDELKQLSVANVIASHVQTVMAVVHQGGPPELAQIHTDAILGHAHDLASHTDEVVANGKPPVLKTIGTPTPIVAQHVTPSWVWAVLVAVCVALVAVATKYVHG